MVSAGRPAERFGRAWGAQADAEKTVEPTSLLCWLYLNKVLLSSEAKGVLCLTMC